jgi:hypothetical protein
MGLTQFRYGILFVLGISFITWLAIGAANICGFVDYAYGPPPDARTYGCDNLLTRQVRMMVGDLYRSPSYDFVYDPNLSFVWLSGVGLAIWALVRWILQDRERRNRYHKRSIERI